MKTIKKILGVVGILAIAFVVFVLLTDDGDITKEMDKSADAEYGDEYSFKLENGDTASIKLPKSIREDMLKNLTDERERAIFGAIYNYDQLDDVYVAPVPNDDQSFRDMLKGEYAVGTLFNFTMDLIQPDGAGMLIGHVVGDTSVEALMCVDPSYLGDEKYDFMGGEVLNFDVVYAGLDNDSDPVFIALKMDVISE